MQETTTPDLPSAAPELPAAPVYGPELPPELPAAPAFDLGAAEGSFTPPGEEGKPAKAARVEPMSPEMLIGAVAQISSIGLGGATRQLYVAEFQNNPVVQLGVEMSQITETLAEMGFGAGGGKMPSWLSLALGLGALSAGVVMTRGKVQHHAQLPHYSAETPGAGSDSGSPVAGGAVASALTGLGHLGTEGQFHDVAGAADPEVPDLNDGDGGDGGGWHE